MRILIQLHKIFYICYINFTYEEGFILICGSMFFIQHGGFNSKATATIRVEDINANSRLFISSSNAFLIGEKITGSISGATGLISKYRANPVENVSNLMSYADVDDTVDTFFDQFKEAFMKTIPRSLATGIDQRNILKNI